MGLGITKHDVYGVKISTDVSLLNTSALFGSS